MNPEHIHLLINHIPIHGLAFSTLFLVIALLLKNRLLVGISAAVITVCGLSIPFIMSTGEGAYERYENTPELWETIGESGLEAAHVHYERAEKGAKATYLLIVLGIVSILVWKFRPEWLIKMGWSLALLCVVCLFLNAWIASSGGKIRRPDFRAEAISTESHEDMDSD
jgi:peptidoglycan/LPS O-acetylase OafA/YrhL